MPAPRSLTPKAGQTRSRLLEAGRRAFARRGLDGVNLKRDVLDVAGVSVGSFYHQFEDKADLLVAILEEHGERIRARFRVVHRPDARRSPEQIAADSYSLVFDVVDENLHATRIQLREGDGSDPRVRRFIEADRSRWRASLAADYQCIADAYGVSLEVELAADLVSMLTQGAIQQYARLPREERAKARGRLIDGLVRLTLHGLPGLAPARRAPSDSRRPQARSPSR